MALGQGAAASGGEAVALGENAVASGSTNATAVGFGSSATFANSTAIGAGAVTTAPNQIVFGTASNTYVAPGITSAASLAAQTGTTTFVTTDASGHLASSGFGPETITSLTSSVASLNQSVAGLQQDVSKAFEGTAIAIAMGGVALPSDKHFAVSFNWGTFNGQNAGAFAGQYRVTDNIVVNGAVGFGFAQGGVGGRAGATFEW